MCKFLISTRKNIFRSMTQYFFLINYGYLYKNRFFKLSYFGNLVNPLIEVVFYFHHFLFKGLSIQRTRIWQIQHNLFAVNYLHTKIMVFTPKKTDNQIKKNFFIRITVYTRIKTDNLIKKNFFVRITVFFWCENQNFGLRIILSLFFI